jgi:allophanate hydrolase
LASGLPEHQVSSSVEIVFMSNVPDIPVRHALHAFYAAGGNPSDVIRATYARINAVADPGIFISMVAEEDAVSAAFRLPPFDPVTYPLWGLPFAVKDNIDVAGMETTAACPGFAYRADKSATVVEKIQAAGAILVGKTNLDQFATGLVGVRSPYPVPRNAIDPALVPGGSSSGSAVAVAQGIVTFSLGTDTAGSGRVPAALNNIIGLKPSVGAVSTRGVVPACRTLDCVSVFALTAEDAFGAFTVMAGYDVADPYSRAIPISGASAEPSPVIGIPQGKDLQFFGDATQEAAWTTGLKLLESLGCKLAPIDFGPLFETAALLYEGPWVAERHAAVVSVLEKDPSIMHPVTRRIIAGANGFSASKLFEAQYRLQALKRQTAEIWHKVSMLAVPTTPVSPTLAELQADPLTPNSRCGTYTNFVNLLDMAAFAAPGPFRSDGRAAGITFIAPSGHDGRLAAIGQRFHGVAGVMMGATGAPLPPATPITSGADELIEIVVVGAHLSGMPLNHELTGHGGVFRRAVTTTPDYRFHALAGGPPKRPGLLRVADGTGLAVATEVWALPPQGFGRFVQGIPSPLGIGTLRLADGTTPKGFLVEPEGLTGAEDISRFGGWRAYMASLSKG